MVARPGTYQASNNAGELSPEEYGRTDLKQFYSALAYARNIEPVPQGGSRQAPRTRHLGRARRQLVAITPTGSGFTAGPHSVAGVVAFATFASQPVSAFRIAGAASLTTAAILQIELLIGGVWTSSGDPFSMDTTSSVYTVAGPPRQPITAEGARLRILSNPVAPITFTGGAVTAFSETGAAAPAARIVPFTYSLTETYVALLTDLHADFYRDGVYVGAAYSGITAAQLLTVDFQQRLETLLAFHKNIRPGRIMRFSDSRWVWRAAPYRNIPNVDLGDTYTNQVTDIWQIYLRFPTTGTYAGGNNLILSMIVNGEPTNVVSTGAPNWPVFANDVRIAIEALGAVDTGLTVVEDVANAANGSVVLTLTFGGANKGNVFTLAAQVVNTTDAAATVAHTLIGKAGGEALMSDAKGYPAAGGFYQDRLFIGGFKSKLGAFEASVTGEYYDLNVDLTAASGAVLGNLDTAGAEQIQKIVPSKHLLFFTSDGEYYISDRAISRTTPPNTVNSSRNGSPDDLPIVESEGEIIYASRNKSILFACSYDDVAQAYVSTPISLLASHIVRDMVDMARQRPSTSVSSARLWMPRLDGTMTVGVMLRNQEVTAFVRWWTPGLVRRVCVDGKNVAHLLVERIVNGVAELHFERLEDDLIFDGVIEQTMPSPTTIITGLAAHEGAEVWAEADGYVVGPYTVAAGSITIDAPSTHVLVGRWTPALARTLPLPSEVAERVVLKRPKRVHTVKLDLIDTTSVAVGANGRPARNVALSRVGDPIDQPMPPVSRMENITGLTGFSNDGQVEITQTKPGRLAWRGITIEARG